MKTKIKKLTVLLSITIISAVLVIIFELKSNLIGSTITGWVVGIFTPFLVTSIVDLTDNQNWKTSQRQLKRAGLIQNDTFIRISFAYLFRIKVDGKYFLVQSTRTKKYQPVGGAYQFTKEEKKYLSDYIPVENDDRIPVDEVTNLDYRLLVKNKDLRMFVKRFNKTRHRENESNVSREFIEEIFATNILNKDDFGSLNYKFCGRHMTNVDFTIFDHYELLLADIFEVQLSGAQEKLFRNLMKTDCNKFLFANADDIRSLGVKFGTNEQTDTIANHTPKILVENEDRLIIRNRNRNVITVPL